MDSISHVIVIFESGRVRHWQDTVTAAADIYSVNRHALGNAVTALQYEALAGDALPRQERPSHRMLIRALCATSGAEAAVAEEWLGLLCEAVRGAAEPEDGHVAPV